MCGRSFVVVAGIVSGLFCSATPAVSLSGANSPPHQFSLIAPPDGSTLNTAQPTFVWQKTTDPDSGDRVSYVVQFTTDSGFGAVIISIPILSGDTSYTPGQPLFTRNLVWFWRVVAVDSYGEKTFSREIFRFTIQLADTIPPRFVNLPFPILPDTMEPFILDVTIIEKDGLDSVTLWLRRNYQIWQAQAMYFLPVSDSEYLATALIPPVDSGTLTELFLSAVDKTGNYAFTDTFGYFTGIMPIETIHLLDSLGQNQLKGYGITIEGEITRPPGRLYSDGSAAFIQDQRGGAVAISTEPYGQSPRLRQRLRVIGIIGQRAGQDLVEGYIQGSLPAKAVQPRPLILDSISENKEGILVVVSALHKVSGDWPAAGEDGLVVVANETETEKIPVFIDKSTELNGMPEPQWPVGIVAVVMQYDTTLPYWDGYILAPRVPGDFIAAGQPVTAKIVFKPDHWNRNWFKEPDDEDDEDDDYLDEVEDDDENNNNDNKEGKLNCYIGNLSGYPVSQIIVESVRLNEVVSVARKKDCSDLTQNGIIVTSRDDCFFAKIIKKHRQFGGSVLKVKFNKFEAIQTIPDNIKDQETTSVLISGYLQDGTPFEGRGIVIIVGDDEQTGIPRDWFIDSEQQLNLRLLGVFPNPFNPRTTIRYVLDKQQHISFVIFSLTGQRVRSVNLGWQLPGEHLILWDGTDDSGRQVGSGVYFFLIKGEKSQIDGRMLLLK